MNIIGNLTNPKISDRLCYNSQPGVFIDYSTGVSYLSGDITYKPN